MKNFALIGSSGYIAPRHMQAIKETGNELVAALDPYDGAGRLDNFFPDTHFFTEFERFDRHLDKLKRRQKGVDYISVCSPNYLHDAHIRFGLRLGANVICEKPLVLNPWNAEALLDVERESGRKVSTIFQLRLHPSIVALKKLVEESASDKLYDIDLTYITSRGNWYYTSWKGDVQKSGGIATNIGIHFFDMLIWIFGGIQKNIVHVNAHDRAAGFLLLKKARVRWFLSINKKLLPESVIKNSKSTYRSLTLDGKEIEFSEGFENLHTLSYREILAVNGLGIQQAIPSIQLVHDVRNQPVAGLIEDYHPMAKEPTSKNFY